MRRISLVAAAAMVCACAPKEKPAADSAAAAPPPPPAAVAPTALTADMVAGTWNGTSMAEQSDSVLSRWVSKRTGDGTSELTVADSKTPIKLTSTFAGDSMVSVSEPVPAPNVKNGPKVVIHSVGRLSGGKLSGTSWQTLADKPDSVIARSRWEATKAP